MSPADWLLTARQRDNPATVLDRRHGDGVAWSAGNDVRPLVHGGTYFPVLLESVRALEKGDLLLFTDWRSDPDERLAGPGTDVSTTLCDAAARGVLVRGLVWRSHLDRLQFSERENRHLGEEIEAAGGQCLLDMRVRLGGSHHQKFVVLRHPAHPERDVAFVGGIDLCHSRNDDAAHAGDPQRQPMAAVYGTRPPWHDVQVAIRGPAVGDVEAVFRERWDDPSPLSRNPFHRLRDLVQREDIQARPLPPQLPDPPACGRHTVQLLRTYPFRHAAAYPFAPRGERSVARGFGKALRQARALIYLEDQYLWSGEVVEQFAEALRRHPDLRLIAVLPRFPDQDGRASLPANLVGRIEALHLLRRAGGDRVAVYSPENHAGVPVYVHAKVCIIDDVWAAVGSANLNRRSWTHDSELSCVILDEPGDANGARAFAGDLRLRLSREHLDLADDADLSDPDLRDLSDPIRAFDEFARRGSALDDWHRGGRVGARPPGRLRPYRLPPLSAGVTRWTTPLYRIVYDPDGRPPALRRDGRF